MSRDYHAKRLAKEQGIPYAEALRRVRQAREAPGTVLGGVGPEDRLVEPPEAS